MGFDFIAKVHFTIESFGERPSGQFGPPEHYDPGCDPDFSIDSINLSLEDLFWDEDKNIWITTHGPEFEATGALFSVLASSRKIDEAILSYIEEHEHDKHGIWADYAED
jgi:hypothetical protein